MGRAIVLSKEGKAYKRDAGWMYQAARGRMFHGDVELQLVLHPRQNKDGSASKNRIDLDNAFKAVCDSLIGLAFNDDKQVTRIVAEVGYPLTNGGVSVLIKERA